MGSHHGAKLFLAVLPYLAVLGFVYGEVLLYAFGSFVFPIHSRTYFVGVWQRPDSSHLEYLGVFAFHLDEGAGR